MKAAATGRTAEPNKPSGQLHSSAKHTKKTTHKLPTNKTYKSTFYW
jgi:hypothetical protein